MISCIDDAVAGLLAHLEERGISDNTVVIFTSDHGDFMGDHGIILKHGLHCEGVLRVPFIWTDPGRPGPAPVRTNLPGSSVELGATILSRAGLAPFNGNQGLPLLELLDDTVPNPRRGILIEEDGLGAHLGTNAGMGQDLHRGRLAHDHMAGNGGRRIVRSQHGPSRIAKPVVGP